MESLDWQGWLTLGVVLLVLIAMVRGLAPPDLIMLAGLIVLGATGVLTPEETFSGFANPAMATVAALFVLSAAMRETGALELTLGRLFGKAKTEFGGMVRTLPVLAGLSGFLNNAPIVAMMTPLVIDWCRRHNIAPSRMLIPLSYSTILGSSITVIGTSVTLTVAALVNQSGMESLSLFELAPVGIPMTITGLLYLFFVAPRILPSRSDPASTVGERRREYTVSMLVEPDCTLIEQSIEAAGLRGLPGLFLFEIRRGERVITSVSPETIIRSGDHLVFAGVVSTIVDLQRIRGLVPIDDEDTPARGTHEHRLTEAVISRSSPLIGRTLKAASFRGQYDAAVIAVHRNGERVPGKLGQITLNAGDTLVFQASSDFAAKHANSPDFYLVSEVPESHVPRHDRAWLAIGVFALMVILAATNVIPISIGSFVAGGFLIAARCITGEMARKSIQMHVLVVIASGLGIAAAIEKTGAATAIANVLVSQSEAYGPVAILATVYLVTMLMSEMLHHNASAALMFPVAVAAAGQAGVDPRSFIIAVALGAQSAFASPVAYQTHLLVYGPGGYRFTDFVKVGIPLNLICATIAITVIPRIWPF
ncbi:MAG: SLC13 family permease [Proteobacteria bacterium]|jgi:di/tricarboxylate transporter|nr:SLC13 family permease [Pseudomonadota bacterium]MDE0909669.1 SLC13 family permease [Myxococcota bacterium]